MALNSTTAIIILAAGLGTRMKSAKAKVLHLLNGQPMILYVVEAATKVAGNNVIVVTGHQAEEVKETVSAKYCVQYAYQSEQKGTGHAVQCAFPLIMDGIKEVIILCGDVPLLTHSTIEKLIDTHRSDAHDITVLAVKMKNPTGYGRMIVDSQGKVMKIVEQADATTEQKAINVINSGIYCVKKDILQKTLMELRPNNAQKELYFTDIIEIGNRNNAKIGLLICADADEVIGVNSQMDLAEAEKLIGSRQLNNS